jgi:hypothetical protein
MPSLYHPAASFLPFSRLFLACFLKDKLPAAVKQVAIQLFALCFLLRIARNQKCASSSWDGIGQHGVAACCALRKLAGHARAAFSSGDFQ